MFHSFLILQDTSVIIFQNLDQSSRHYYEVIREHQPCKLYFDIEFKKELNQTVNGEKLLQTFIGILLRDLKSKFDVLNINEKEHVLNLTSTTEKKFSHHIVINHPQLIFVNNYSAGKYVKCLCQKLRNMPEMIIVTDEKSETRNPSHKTKQYGTFIDEGVYTKNRNFRLYLSSKFNKKVPLKLFSASNQGDKCIFLNSLVTVVESHNLGIGNNSTAKTKLITFEFDEHQNVSLIDWTSEKHSVKNSTPQIRYLPCSGYPY